MAVVRSLLTLATIMFLTTNVTSNRTEFHPVKSFIMSNIIDTCDEKPTSRHTILQVFSVTVLLTAVLGNLLTIVVILSSRHLRNKNSHVFLISLAVADLGVSFFVTSVKVDMYSHNGMFCHTFALCVFFQITDSLFPITSITHLLVLCVDRWYAITKPYSYVKIATTRRAKLIVAFVWLYSLIWTFLGMFRWKSPVSFTYEVVHSGTHNYCYSRNKNYFTTLVTSIYIIPMFIIASLNTFVLRVAMKKSQAAMPPKQQQQHLQQHLQQHITTQPKNRRKSIPTIRKFSLKSLAFALGINSKAIRTIGMVLIAYIVCWLPHVVVIIIQYCWEDVLFRFSVHLPTAYDVTTTIISNVLPTLNSCINPFIYFILSDEFRVALVDLARRSRGMPRYVEGVCARRSGIDMTLRKRGGPSRSSSSMFRGERMYKTPLKKHSRTNSL